MAANEHCDRAGLQEILERYRQNFPAFEQEMERLERDHLGEFVVIAHGEVVGIYATKEQPQAADASSDAVVFEIGHHQFRRSPR